MATNGTNRRKRKAEAEDRRKRPAPITGTAVTWPSGVEQRYGISAVTRWRWERDGLLPPRDVHVGGRDGWRPETLESFRI